jgi:hypothetical protein
LSGAESHLVKPVLFIGGTSGRQKKLTLTYWKMEGGNSMTKYPPIPLPYERFPFKETGEEGGNKGSRMDTI